MNKQNRFVLCMLCLTLVCSSLVGCSSYEGYNTEGANVTKNGEYNIAAKSNMLKGLELRRTEQSTRPINPSKQGGLQPLAEGHEQPASTLHINEQLFYWSDVSRALKQIEGVATAHVFATNKNIYAAIMYNNDALATNGNNETTTELQQSRDNELNPIYRDVAILLSNYGAPREVFISSDHEFFHELKPLVKIEQKNRSLLPFVHEFNMIVQRYFEDRLLESIPSRIDDKKIIF